MASVQRRKSKCPLCRACFPADLPLEVNGELRDLVALFSTLHTVEQADGWQELAATKAKKGFFDHGSWPAQMGDPEGCVALVPPTASPVHCDLDSLRGGGGDLLSLEPPMWVPDSHAGSCTSCSQVFRPLSRGRHHCRLCGNIFCSACCGHRQLLPPKFRAAEPQRTCAECAALLQPLQPFLAGTISRAVQPAVRDVMDASCPRSWVNTPLTTSGLPGDIYKAANIAAAFRRIGAMSAERQIPAAVLRGAAGFAILSIAKVGLGWSAGVGSGLVVARREDDSWGPPSALAACSAGWGLQVGGGLTDHLIVLRSPAAIAAFCGSFAAGITGGASIAAGPVGRQADAGMTMGPRGAALCYSYSLSRGAFAGIAIEGTLVTTRESANLAFYGRPLSAQTLLATSEVQPPAAASALYQALDELLTWAEALPSSPGYFTARGIKARDAAAAAATTVTVTAASAMTTAAGAPQDGGMLGASSRHRSHRSASGQSPSEAESPSFPAEHHSLSAEASGEGNGWLVHDGAQVGEGSMNSSDTRAYVSEDVGQMAPSTPTVSDRVSDDGQLATSSQGGFGVGPLFGNGILEDDMPDGHEDNLDSLPPVPTFTATTGGAERSLPSAGHQQGGSLSYEEEEDMFDGISSTGLVGLYAE